MLDVLAGEVLPQVRGFTQVLAGGAGLNRGAELGFRNQRQALGQDGQLNAFVLEGEQDMAEQIARSRCHAGGYCQGLTDDFLAGDRTDFRQARRWQRLDCRLLKQAVIPDRLHGSDPS
ncbi:hypothetical protein [Aquipseudomonas alcaligenes]|uniref:hypothetical protein n=1 Tax=Aquipseudomonas alcaligenes TaxID=43263 RepID=UPI00194309C8|nr:hypothetical protein [Pseudomonas alcaligenes]